MKAEMTFHTPVLADDVVRLAEVTPGDRWVDCTLGFGGHSTSLLERGASVIGIDQDADARTFSKQRLAHFDDQIHIVAGNFGDVAELLDESGDGPVDGILADIGVSSFQLDEAERGFSFRRAGPIDMRMNRDAGESALELIKRLTQRELTRILKRYGEEPLAGVIARAIKAWATENVADDTTALAAIIAEAMPNRVRSKLKHHPATRTFQALRIAVNDELGALERLLAAIPACLKPGGRALVISFHSLEDRLVKRAFNRWSGRNVQPGPGGRALPVVQRPAFELLTTKPVTASAEECGANPRARTAKLRAVRKLEIAA